MICVSCGRHGPYWRWCSSCAQLLGADDGVRLAGFGQRFAALAIDLLAVASIVFIGTVILRAPVAENYPLEIRNVVASNLGGAAPLNVLLIGYALLTLVLHSGGQTVGKAIVGIRLGVQGGRSGRRAGFGRTLLREVILRPSIALITLGLAPLWSLWDADRQALYDKGAWTLVIDDRKRAVWGHVISEHPQGLLTKPSPGAPPVINGLLSPGDAVSVLRERRGYVEVRAGGHIGWLRRDVLLIRRAGSQHR